jgi:hypothetical protein
MLDWVVRRRSRVMNFQQVIQSVWSLRAGVLLAFLPVPAFGIAALYSFLVTRHAQRIPEDAWPVLAAIVFFLIFAGICLLPSVLLLWSHLRRSRLARWAFGFALVEIVLLASYIVYVNVAA